MSGVVVAVTVALFLGGVVTGVIAVIALAIRREDRRYTLVREAPDRISRSARRLTGVGRRGLDAEFFPIARVEELEAKLRAAGVDFEAHRYLARHAFANEDAVGDGRIAETQYDRVWAERAWDRTFAFLGRTLAS